MKVKNCTLIRPLSCKVGTGIVEAAKILREKKQRRLIVVDAKDYPVGIVSTTDMSNKVVADGKDPKDMKVDEVMSKPIFLQADMEDSLDDVFKKMRHHESYFVPVTKGKKLYGVLTYGEIVHQANEAIKNAR